MLTDNELRDRLTGKNKFSGDWMRAYIDKSGLYWISGNGGQGLPAFTKLKKGHPFGPLIEELVKESSLLQQELQFEYYAQEELSLLARSGDTHLERNKETKELLDAITSKKSP